MALAFYEKVFGFTHDEMPMPDGTYYILKQGNKGRAGLFTSKHPMPTMWTPNVPVADCDAIVAKAAQLGATVCMPSTDIPGVGRLAMFNDPQGASIAIRSPTRAWPRRELRRAVADAGRRLPRPRSVSIARPMTAPTATPDLGDLRRLTPIDSGFGGGRGKPVDRHYIEDFLRRHAADIRGRVLEVAEDDYTSRTAAGASSRATSCTPTLESARDAGRRPRRRRRDLPDDASTASSARRR